MEHKNNLPISVLIPTMNRPKALQRTLHSICNGTDIPAQIVIVDQSEDKNVCQLNKSIVNGISPLVDVVYVYQDKPSLTMARNNALKRASYDTIVFSDDDVDVYEDTYKNVAAYMENKNIALIAGLDDNTKKSKSNIGYLLGTKSYRKRKIGHVTKSMLGRYPDIVEDVTETEWAMGYFFVIRKKLVNLFDISWDEAMSSYAYAEDLDFSYSYCKMASQNGFQCILTPEIHIKHLASQEFRVPSYSHTWMYVVHRRY